MLSMLQKEAETELSFRFCYPKPTNNKQEMESTIQSISNAPTAVQDKKQGLWTCEICNHPMGEGSQQSHLAGKKHKAKAQKIEQRSSNENSPSVHGNLMELGSPKTGALAREVITDPVVSH